jgi:hypothetical protein
MATCRLGKCIFQLFLFCWNAFRLRCRHAANTKPLTKDFFIAIEWLKIKKNESSADSKEQIAYLPSVGWKIKTDSTLNFWHLFYNNEWYKHKEGTLLMSAILKK